MGASDKTKEIPMPYTTKTREQQIAGIRQLADVLEANEDLDIPFYLEGGSEYSSLGISAVDAEDVKRLAKAFPGIIKDKNWQGKMVLRSEVVPIAIYPPEDFCKRVVKGTEKKVVKKKVQDAVFEDVEEEVEVVEWECPDSILR